MIYKENLALLTDLYELTMMQGYFFKDREQKAVFDVFFRRYPFGGSFAVFAGLDPLIDAILSIRFEEEEINYLKSLGIFKEEFLNFLKEFKFSGDIYAVKEGEIVFSEEPLFRIHGKLIELQLLESLILNFLNFQTLIATKTARIVIAARGGAILEFGLRRAQGIDGAISATRAAFIGGAVATSNTLAGKLFNIPVRGTMAHSWVMSFKSEIEAFRKYAEMYPENCILLVDTYDTLKSGIPNAIKVFKELKSKGYKNYGIRLDSGDLEFLSKKAREMLDQEGLKEAKIYASNELDEWIIDHLVKVKAPIDAWGVGTKLITADRDPSLSGVYKIVAKTNGKDFEPCIKISNNPEKITNPGIKNVYRFYGEDGKFMGDLIHLEDESDNIWKNIEERKDIRFNHPNIDYAHFCMKNYAGAEKLLSPVVKEGKRVRDKKDLKDIQAYTKKRLEQLDNRYKRLINPHIYKVSLSDRLKTLKKKLIKQYAPDFFL